MENEEILTSSPLPGTTTSSNVPTHQVAVPVAENAGMSPVINTTESDTLTFGEAIMELAGGARIKKQEWEPGYYAILKDSKVTLFKPDGKSYDWILSDGDLSGVDWVVIK
jgi:hypothetical protein